MMNQQRGILCMFIFFCSLAGPILRAQDTTGVGSISGLVKTVDGAPVIGTKVCLLDFDRCVNTDQEGTFRFTDLRAGDYRLQVTLPDAKANTLRSEPIQVRAGLEGNLEITLPALATSQESITVSASAFAIPDEIKTSDYQITQHELLKVAGAQQDISRYLQSLPGVTFGSDDFRNDIVVRGGSPLENLFIVDNIEIPNINSFATLTSAGGSVSLLDPYLIQDSTFLSGGAPAAYINRLSGILQVAEREGNRNQFVGQLTLSSAGVGGILEGPIRHGKGSWVVSARRSFLDAFTKDIGFGGVPVNYSFNAKVVYDLTANDRIWVSNISGLDKITIHPNGVSKDQQINIDNVQNNGWRSSTGFNWQHLYGDKTVGLLGVAYSATSTNTSVSNQLQNNLTVYTENNSESQSTFKYDLSAYTGRFGKVQLGGNATLYHINYSTQQPYGFDNPYSAVPATDPFFLTQDYLSDQAGAYAQSTLDLSRRLSLTLGVRFDHYAYTKSNRASPRAGLSYRITDKLSWHADYGTYYQQPAFLFLSVFPENRLLKPIQSRTAVTGIAFLLTDTLRFTVEGYWKQYADYPVAVEYPALSVANIGNTFDTRGVLFPMSSNGKGRAEGVEFFVEKKFTRKLFGQANLAWARDYYSGLDGILRPGAYDSPVVINTVGGYQFNRKWEVSARFTYLSGRPYTPFNSTLSNAQDRAVYDLTQVNGVRAPAYIRGDFRVDRTFTVRDKPLLVFAGVENLFNRKNFQELDWNRRLDIPQTSYQLGLFPEIGVDWHF